MDISVCPSTIAGSLTVSASKSHTIRAYFFALLAEGESCIYNPLEGLDGQSALQVCKLLGGSVSTVAAPLATAPSTAARIAMAPSTAAQLATAPSAPSTTAQVREAVHDLGGYVIVGTGGAIQKPTDVIDVGNSGTTMRIATAIAALSASPITLDGDAQIRARPIVPLLQSLVDLGATVVGLDKPSDVATDPHGASGKPTHPPFTICGPLHGGTTTIACTTSQYLTALLMVAPLLPHDTTITVTTLNERPYIDMTLEWLNKQCIKYSESNTASHVVFHIEGGQHYTPFTYTVESDYSSAAFMIVAAAVVGGGVTIRDLPTPSHQADSKILTILEWYGITVERQHNDVHIPQQEVPAVLVADVATKSGSTVPLHNTTAFGRAVDASRIDPASSSQSMPTIEIDVVDCPDLLPILMVLACNAHGNTTITNISHTRHKETDRPTVMTAELTKLGAQVTDHGDYLTVVGTPHKLHGAEVNSHHDHRVAMALVVAGLAASGATTVHNAECIAVSYPTFLETIEQISKQDTITYLAQ